MNRDNILEILSDNVGNRMTETQLLMAIEDAILQIETARQFFESVSDPKLVDCAIYMEEAAKARYSFLLTEAKRLNLKTQHENILFETKAV